VDPLVHDSVAIIRPEICTDLELVEYVLNLFIIRFSIYCVVACVLCVAEQHGASTGLTSSYLQMEDTRPSGPTRRGRREPMRPAQSRRSPSSETWPLSEPKPTEIFHPAEEDDPSTAPHPTLLPPPLRRDGASPPPNNHPLLLPSLRPLQPTFAAPEPRPTSHPPLPLPLLLRLRRVHQLAWPQQRRRWRQGGGR
jgi:hypothetical protein